MARIAVSSRALARSNAGIGSIEDPNICANARLENLPLPLRFTIWRARRVACRLATSMRAKRCSCQAMPAQNARAATANAIVNGKSSESHCIRTEPRTATHEIA